MNGDDPAPRDEIEKARDLALHYRCEFVNLGTFRLQPELLGEIPADLMLRYKFVPLAKTQDGRIAIAVADPSQLMLFDEISLLLGKRIVIHVATLAQINKILNRAEDSPTQMPDPSPGEPDAPVRAPLKPRPHSRSGAAKAVPE
jgi:type IV pilus assembly protein PilB